MRALSMVVVLSITAGMAPAQDLLPEEVHALELKSQGRYRLARDAFLELLAGESGARDARGAALAEFHATMAVLLNDRVAPDGASEAALSAARAASAAAEHPALADALDLQLRSLDLAAGRAGAAMERTRGLGFLTEWWIAGPFSNEGGTGFNRAFEPEAEIDLQKSHAGGVRPVSWRRLPITPLPGGVVDLDALVRPNDHVVCYAMTCLEAERSQDVVLHLGSDEAFKVFLNGREEAARDVRRRFQPDQDAVTLRLAEGPNLLMIKVCDREGAFAFAARLRGIDGRPVAGVLETGEPAAIERAAKTGPGEAPTGVPFLGARKVLKEGAASGNAADALRLGLMLAILQPDDANDRTLHQLARQATDAMPDLPAARYLLAFTRLRNDTIAAEKEENARRQDYEVILARDPECAEALRSLAELEMSSIGSAVLAEKLLRRALEVNPEFTSARQLLARSLEAQGLEVLGAEQLHLAAGDADGHAAPVAARFELAQRLAAAGDLARAAEIHREILGVAAQPDHLQAAAEVALRQGRRDEGVALLERAIELAPLSSRPRWQLAALYEAEGDWTRALATLGECLRICPEDDTALVRLSRLHGLAGNADQQRETLAAAVELNPNLRAERRHLEFLEADAIPFFTDFRIDGDDVLAADPGPRADAATANDPYDYLLDQRVVRAWRNGTTSDYRHVLLRILTEEGANRMRRYAVPHYPGEQRARVLAARVLRADGSVMRPRLGGAGVALPALVPGDVVEVEARVDDLGPTFFGEYFGLEHRFIGAEGVPLRRAMLTVILDPGRDYRFQSVNGAPEAEIEALADGTTVCRYEIRDVGRIRFEERQPSVTEREPLVRITTFRDWDHFTSWWWSLIKPQIDVSPEMVAKVRELTEGLTTDREKIDAIYGFVTTDIRYEAWEFGVHGYKPYNTSVIFERRHGDCKDKALLLTAMLAEVGIESRPVLLLANELRSADDLSLPLVGHFNHCISYLPPEGDRPGLYLDGTASYHPSDTVPAMDRGADVLIVEGERGRLAKIPWFDADQNRDSFEYRIELSPSGGADVRLTHRPSGPRAVLVRQALGNEPGRRAEVVERNLTRSFGNVSLREVETGDLLDLSRPVELEMRFSVPEFALEQGGDLLLGGALQTRPLHDLATATSRRNPLLLGPPDSEHHLIRYRLPAGFTPVALPPPVALRTRFGSYLMSWTRDEDEVTVERLRSFHVNRIEPEEYEAFRELIGQIEQADSQVLVLKRRTR